ncbi:MAG: Fic family protein [bacterium]|nr:Fic family protein [bacterium]
MNWQPITNLPDDWQTMIEKHRGLHELVKVWQEQRQKLENTNSYKLFMEKLRRKIAIETGVIERLYTIDRGITYLLIEQGIDESLIPHGTTDKPASEIVRIIRDHEASIQQVFNFVGAQRDLSTSFIKQLHQLLTRNQEYTEGKDQFGTWGKFPLLRGDWKQQVNNPQRADGTFHEYCPPLQVQSEMDNLIQWHLEHLTADISPEVEAAWLHHRFTQIHPFQDGNGRVARNLATLIFLRAGWFPLTILNNGDETIGRLNYIEALETADDGDLEPLVDLFAQSQKQAFMQSLSLSEDVLNTARNYQASLGVMFERLRDKEKNRQEEELANLKQRTDSLFEKGLYRFNRASQDMRVGFQNLLNPPDVRVYSADNNSDKSHYYRYQIIETAKYHTYYANLDVHKSWVCLSLKNDDLTTKLLISFHMLGQEVRGVMIVSSCIWRESPSEDGAFPSIENLTPLSHTFEITLNEENDSLNRRYENWLEEIIVLGLNYIVKNI